MTDVRACGADRALPFAIDLALLAGLLLTLASGPSPPAMESLHSASSHSVTPNDLASGASLTVDPPSFWMRTGENLSLQAVWTAGSPLCEVSPLWYDWSIEEGSATGYLNESTGPTTTFFADSFTSGSVGVELRSGADLRCGENATVVDRSEGVTVTMAVPFSLTGVEAGPNLLPAGGNATLQGSVTGGSPPYSLEISWGDGTRSIVNQTAPGAFAVNHTFPAGEFEPYVLASDSAGDVENRSAAESLFVGPGLAAVVIPASYVAEVGVPAEFVGVDQDPPPGAITLFDCSNATVGPPSPAPVPNATAYSCTFWVPGTSAVVYGVFPSAPGGPSESAVLYETVVPPPELAVAPTEMVGEVGGSALVQLTLTGGALPVSVAWNLTGNRSGGSEVVGVDGSGVVSLSLTAPGEYTLGVRASDPFKGVAANNTFQIQVDPPLRGYASGARSFVNSGALVKVAGETLSGCPPFSWWAVPDAAPGNETPPGGTLDTIGGFSWNATYDREGELAVTVGVTDSCGIVWEAVLVVPLVSPLAAEFTAAPVSSPNETLAVNLSIEGGWPPFRLVVNASDNESWNRTFWAIGSYHCRFPTQANGSLVVTALISDSLNASTAFRTSVSFPPKDPAPPSPPPSTGSVGATGSPGPSIVDVLGLLASFAVPAGLAAYVALRWRRRARKDAGKPDGPNPEAVLKKIIEPAEGAERFTVELLAEEAGIPLAVVRSTIDRLVAQGTVLSESGADGEEVLSWSSESGR